jgi:hypothetical protein
MALWGKDDQTRLNETFDFIASKVPGNEQTVVLGFLRNWLNRTYGAGSNQLSQAMSTSGFNNTGDKQTRAARRALVILRGDMLNAANPLRMTANQIMNMASGQVVTALEALLPNFRIFAQQEERVTTGLQIRFNQFVNNPQTFLANAIVVCQSAPGAGGVGAAIDHRFILNYADQNYMLLPLNTAKPQTVRGDGLIVKAVNVPEMYWFNVPRRDNNPVSGSFARIPATELTGADLMVTSAFTGCSFCFKSNGGSVYAAHISPDGTAANAGPSIGAAPALATQLGGANGAGTGDFASPPGATAGALSVFGRGFSNLGAFPNGYTVNAMPGTPLTAASMYVFGIRRNNVWHLIYQENNAGAHTTGVLL